MSAPVSPPNAAASAAVASAAAAPAAAAPAAAAPAPSPSTPPPPPPAGAAAASTSSPPIQRPGATAEAALDEALAKGNGNATALSLINALFTSAGEIRKLQGSSLRSLADKLYEIGKHGLLEVIHSIQPPNAARGHSAAAAKGAKGSKKSGKKSGKGKGAPPAVSAEEMRARLWKAQRRVTNNLMGDLSRFAQDNRKNFDLSSLMEVFVLVAGNTSVGKDKFVSLMTGLNLANSSSNLSTVVPEFFTLQHAPDLPPGEARFSMQGHGHERDKEYTQEKFLELRRNLQAGLNTSNNRHLFGDLLHVYVRIGGDDVEPITVLNYPGMVADRPGSREHFDHVDHILDRLKDSGNGVLVVVKKADDSIANCHWQHLRVIREQPNEDPVPTDMTGARASGEAAAADSRRLPILLVCTHGDRMKVDIGQDYTTWGDYTRYYITDTLRSLPHGGRCMRPFITAAWDGDDDHSYGNLRVARSDMQQKLQMMDARIHRLASPQYLRSPQYEADRKAFSDLVSNEQCLDYLYNMAALKSKQPLAAVVIAMARGLATLAKDQEEAEGDLIIDNQHVYGECLQEFCQVMAGRLREISRLNGVSEKMRSHLHALGQNLGRTSSEEYAAIRNSLTRPDADESRAQSLQVPPTKFLLDCVTVDMPVYLRRLVNQPNPWPVIIDNLDTLADDRNTHAESITRWADEAEATDGTAENPAAGPTAGSTAGPTAGSTAGPTAGSAAAGGAGGANGATPAAPTAPAGVASPSSWWQRSGLLGRGRGSAPAANSTTVVGPSETRSIKHRPETGNNDNNRGMNSSHYVGFAQIIDRFWENLKTLTEAFQMPRVEKRIIEAMGACHAKINGVDRLDEVISITFDYIKEAMDSLIAFTIENVTELAMFNVTTASTVALEGDAFAMLRENPQVMEHIEATWQRFYGTELRSWLHYRAQVYRKSHKLHLSTVEDYLLDPRNFKEGKSLSISAAREWLDDFRRVCCKAHLSADDYSCIYERMAFIFRCELQHKIKVVFQDVVIDTLTCFGLLGSADGGDSATASNIFKQLSITILGAEKIQEMVHLHMLQNQGRGPGSVCRERRIQQALEKLQSSIVDEVSDGDPDLAQYLINMVLVHRAGRGGGGGRGSGRAQPEAAGQRPSGSGGMAAYVGSPSRFSSGPYLCPPRITNRFNTERNGLQGLVPTWDDENVLFNGDWFFKGLTNGTMQICIDLLSSELDDSKDRRQIALRRIAQNRAIAETLFCVVEAAHEANAHYRIVADIGSLYRKARGNFDYIRGVAERFGAAGDLLGPAPLSPAVEDDLADGPKKMSEDSGSGSHSADDDEDEESGSEEEEEEDEEEDEDEI